MYRRFPRLALLGLSALLAGCTTVAHVMPGADVLWKDDVVYDGDGLEYPELSTVPDRPEASGVETAEEELVETLQSDLERAKEIRKSADNP